MKTIAYSLGILLISSAALFAQKPIGKPAELSKHISLPAIEKNTTNASPKKINPIYAYSIQRRQLPAIDRENAENKSVITSVSPVGEIKAFPNPFTTQIDVFITDGAMAKSVYKAILYDLNGRRVYSETLTAHQSSLQLSHLSTGVYFLHIERNGVLIKQERLVKE